jgi:hypothetical protein
MDENKNCVKLYMCKHNWIFRQERHDMDIRQHTEYKMGGTTIPINGRRWKKNMHPWARK